MHIGSISPSWLALHSPGTPSLFSYKNRDAVNTGIMRDMGQRQCHDLRASRSLLLYLAINIYIYIHIILYIHQYIYAYRIEFAFLAGIAFPWDILLV